MQEKFGIYPSLADRVVLVTGGGSGIGASIVRRLAELDAQVAFIDIDQVASADLCEQIASTSCKHFPIFEVVDVTDLVAFQSAIARIEEKTGPIFGLVNNAANDTRHSVEDLTTQAWKCAMSVNLDHQFFAVQSVLPAMKKAGQGSIVNMGSMSWRVGVEKLSAYVSAKAAVEGLTNGLARDLGADGIRVNCVTPGFIKTERQTKLWLDTELEEEVMRGQCLKEFIEPDYVANLVAFLLADDSRMCTSGVYPINGGWI